MVWGYPPGASLIDTVPEDMLELIHPHWKKFPPVNPMWHYLLGLVYIFLGTVSIIGKNLYFTIIRTILIHFIII